MPLRFMLPFAAVFVLLPLSGAQAKGLVSVAVCGRDGCRDVTQRIGDEDVGWLIGDLRRTGRRASRQVPFVEVRIAFGNRQSSEVLHRQRLLYAPALGLAGFAGPWRWVTVDSRGRAVAKRLLRVVRRYPAAQMPRGTYVPWPPPAKARIVEVYAPHRAPSEGGALPWWPFAGGVVLILGLVAAGTRRFSHRGRPARDHYSAA